MGKIKYRNKDMGVYVKTEMGSVWPQTILMLDNNKKEKKVVICSIWQ